MKLKRLLTGVLSAVMALSVCAMPALADEAPAAATPKTGSLTITKYEQPIGSPNSEWQDKERGNPLEGVTFTVYKVADVNQTVDASGNVSFDYDLVAGLKDQITIDWESCKSDTKPEGALDSKKLFDELKKQIDAKKINISTLKPAGIMNPQTTGSDGKAKFENLPCGIYMVEETNAPEQVVSWSASFLVSIPTMNATNDGWLYNVEVEPKNTTAYGGVTLVKYGAVAGSKDNKTLISGAAFLLERKKNDNKWEAVDLTAGKIQVGGATDSSDLSNGKVTMSTTSLNIQGLAHGTYRFTEISAPDGYVADTLTKHEFVLDKQGNITGNDVAADSKSLEITNEKPDFKKEITKREGTVSDNNDADYGVGDKVPYTLTVKVPSTIANLKTFYVTDTINTDHTDNPQLAYDASSFTVSCGGDDLEEGKDYTLVFTKAENKEDVYTGFKIDFKNGTSKLGAAYADKAITISYTAELLGGAVTTKAGNINKAELVYSNKTNIDSTVEEPESDKNTIHDESVVYTFKTSIYKTGAGNAGPLTGVKFDLYKVLEKGTDYTTTADGKLPDTITFRKTTYNNSDVVSGSSLGLANVDYLIKVATDVTTNNGDASVSGLPKGTYYWVETKALDGYNLLTEPVKADLQVTYEATWITKSEYENGKLVKHEYSNSQTDYPTTTVDKIINIVNRKGFTLPVTGGFGTLLFSGIGVLLVLAGVCVLFSMKKKNNRT